MIKANKKGFTLVELVVVIAVLLILAAIAIPTVSGVINDAQKATDAANAKSIETAIKYAIADNEIKASSATTTVSAALALSGMEIGILDAKLADMIFVYDFNTNAVTVSTGTTNLPGGKNIYTGVVPTP